MMEINYNNLVSIAVSEAIKRLFPDKYDLITSVQGDGVKECKKMLDDANEGVIHGRFMEGMGCVGGCVGGPKIIIPKEEGAERLMEFAESSEIRISVESPPMNAFLRKLGMDTEHPSKMDMKIFEREF
jgi:iron only hydrogenase large subunit-like protein